MILRPPISTLSPYTTLFRSYDSTATTGTAHAWRAPTAESRHRRCSGFESANALAPWADSSMSMALVTDRMACAQRSEEHTSELQSHSDLVCRHLLEKKKKNKLGWSAGPTGPSGDCWSCPVLEHMPYLHRLLRPGGRAAVT